MSYIARADGTREEIAPKAVTLKRAQQIVGGYVERVFPMATPDVLFLCDEEGKLKGKLVNEHGCLLYGTEEHGVVIVGDIVVMTHQEARRSGWL